MGRTVDGGGGAGEGLDELDERVLRGEVSKSRGCGASVLTSPTSSGNVETGTRIGSLWPLYRMDVSKTLVSRKGR